jgi:alkylation response protein AidB-like acyl-CoA dehydrogenase
LEDEFQKTVDRLKKIGLIDQKDLGLLERVDSACLDLVTPEYESYIERKFDDRAVPILSKHNLMGIPIERKYGGEEARPLVHSLAMERLGQVGMGIVTLVDVHQFLGSLTIQQWGTQEQKESILPEASRGDSILAYALTEPEAGSDPASMTTSFE